MFGDIMNKNIKALLLAFLAAILYAINSPISKLLLDKVNPTFMASFLYLGAGLGVFCLYLFNRKKEKKSDRLKRSDLKYTIGMIVLDIFAPILMMYGLKYGTSSNASLLGNFEIVATTLIALIIFLESVSKKLWIAIIFITIASIILSLSNGGLDFSIGSLFVILATCCWGLENNCTKNISDKSTYQIVILKGIFSGIGSFIIALFLKEKLPEFKYIIYTMILGFTAYGLSIFTYIRAQRTLGASKTSAYYAINPFIGSFLSFIILKEVLTINYLIGLIFMIIGTFFVIEDTLLVKHTHEVNLNGEVITIEHTHFRNRLGLKEHIHKKFKV